MKYYSFNDNILSKQNRFEGNTFDLFKSTVVDTKLNNLQKTPYIIPNEFDGRLDRVCEFLYNGENKYLEELMKINNIYNIHSIKTGDIIYYVSTEDLVSLYSEDNQTSDRVDLLKINNPKGNVKDANRQKEQLPTVVKDSKNKQINWDKTNKTVSITNKLS